MPEKCQREDMNEYRQMDFVNGCQRVSTSVNTNGYMDSTDIQQITEYQWCHCKIWWVRAEMASIFKEEKKQESSSR